MGKENENYRGWSNYATWAFYMLLTYDTPASGSTIPGLPMKEGNA